MKIGKRITNPGDLRTPIKLQSVTLTKGSGGVQVPSYADLPSPDVMVKWTNAFGQEALQAQALQTKAPATVLMRYRSDVTAQTSILKDGQRWEIVSPPDNVRERNEYLELQVLLTKGGV